MYVFGDFYSYVPNDSYNKVLIGAVGSSAGTETFNGGASSSFYLGDMLLMGTDASQVGHYLDRNSAGSGSSTNFGKSGCTGLMGTNAGLDAGGTASFPMTGTLAFPNTADGGLYMHPIWVRDTLNPDVIHGEMRGSFHVCHAISNFGDQDTFSGAGYFNGRSFLIFKQTPNAGIWCFETSATVNTN
jgi:hypothetical protein